MLSECPREYQMPKLKLDAREVMEDIRSGLTDAELMEKYQLSAKGLQSLFRKLIHAGVITREELEERVRGYEGTVVVTEYGGVFMVVPSPERIDAALEREKIRRTRKRREAAKERGHAMRPTGVLANDVVAEIRAGATDAELMARYQLSVKGLQGLLEDLVDRGLMDEWEVDCRVAPIAGTVDLYEVKKELAADGIGVSWRPSVQTRDSTGTSARIGKAEDATPKEKARAEKAAPPVRRRPAPEVTEPAWYDRTAVVVILLIVIFPLGLYALVKTSGIPERFKAAIACGAGLLVMGIFAAVLLSGGAGSAEDFADLLNTRYKGLCHARIEYGPVRTLVIDWTGGTDRKDAETVMADVRRHAKELFDYGVGFVKYPNERGTYDLLDTETGAAVTTDEKAPSWGE